MPGATASVIRLCKAFRTANGRPYNAQTIITDVGDGFSVPYIFLGRWYGALGDGDCHGLRPRNDV
jgi:hypothetical protein